MTADAETITKNLINTIPGQLFHAQGVPLDSKNSMGETPLDLADHQERHRVAALIQKSKEQADLESLRSSGELTTQTTDAIKKLLASLTKSNPSP